MQEKAAALVKSLTGEDVTMKWTMPNSVCFDCAAVDVTKLARRIVRKMGDKPHQMIIESRQLTLYWDKTTGERYNYWQRKLTYQVNKAKTRGRITVARLVVVS